MPRFAPVTSATFPCKSIVLDNGKPELGQCEFQLRLMLRRNLNGRCWPYALSLLALMLARVRHLFVSLVAELPADLLADIQNPADNVLKSSLDPMSWPGDAEGSLGISLT